MGAKKSVDEIWRELNAKTAPKSRTTGVTGFGLPGVTTHTRVVGGKAPAATAGASAARPGAPSPEDVVLRPDTQRRVAAVQFDPAQAGVAAADLQAYIATMQRTINCLTDADRGTRKGAVQALSTKMMKGDASTPRAAPEMLQAMLCGPLLQPLLAMLHDPVERCRTTALQLLLDAAPQLPDPAALLPALAPELAARAEHMPTYAEPSEEARLQVVELAGALIARCEARQLVASLPDMAQLLTRCQEDSFHEVKKAGCTAIAALAAKAGPAMEPHAERMLQALLGNVSHAHSRVRLAVIQALDALVLAGVPAGLMGQLVAPGIKPLTADRAPAVREAAFAATAHWLGYSSGGAANGEAGSTGAAPEASSSGAAAAAEAEAARVRCRTYARDLLPLLLVGISDPHASTAAHALHLVEAVGDVFVGAAAMPAQAAPSQAAAAAMEVDGAAATSATGQEEAAAGPAVGSSHDAVMQDADEPSGSGSSSEAAPSAAAIAAAKLPPPYTGLPRARARALVRSVLPQLLVPAVKELGEWTVSIRSAAARVLHATLVLAGAAVAPHLPALVPGLCSGMGDEDAEVVGHMRGCMRAVGAFVAPAVWLPLLLDQLGSSRPSPASKANALAVLAALLSAAACAGAPAEPALLGALAGTLAGEELRGVDHPAVRAQLLSVVGSLLQWAGPLAAGVAAQLYLLLLQLYGAAAGAGGGGGGADAGLLGALDAAFEQLAAAAGVEARDVSGAAALSAAHGASVLEAVAAAGEASGWHAGAPHVQVLCALLLTSGAAPLAQVMPRVTELLAPALGDPEGDAALRLALLHALDGLMEDPARRGACSGASAAPVLQRLLLPPLVWRAGKTAAAVRFAAVTALATLLRWRLAPSNVLTAALALPLQRQQPGGGAPAQQPHLLPLVLQCLDEDWYSDVRLTACYVVQQLLGAVGAGSWTGEQLRSIYPELLKRLDDSSNQVRVAACGALCAFVAAAGPGYCPTNASYLAAGVVIHMDDSDPAVQEAACAVLEALVGTHPRQVEAEVGKVRPAFRAQHYCDRVLARAGQASGGS